VQLKPEDGAIFLGGVKEDEELPGYYNAWCQAKLEHGGNVYFGSKYHATFKSEADAIAWIDRIAWSRGFEGWCPES
jgi:hypothetical protein